MAIENVEDLDEWYKFTAGYADGTRSDDRKLFDVAAAKTNKLFDTVFTDDAIALFVTAGIIGRADFVAMLQAVRGADKLSRQKQSAAIQAALLDSGTVPVKEKPRTEAAITESGRYLKDDNPDALRKELVEHWAKTYEIRTGDASEVLDEAIDRLKEVNGPKSTYTDYKRIMPIVAQFPVVDETKPFPDNP
ncbi:MAG: hypothetical protein E4H01_00760 [Lysobacterales bacterium]|nr:MAG: hypothetical protein E4H01_00760 [Xanthomonadales bacterium]